MIKSPITKSNNVKLIKDVDVIDIVNKYKKFLNINVQRFFDGLEKISLYQCLDSGYLFYYPDSIFADSDFYEKIQNFSWYYMPWKWEHEIANTLIGDSDCVLEIGCAKGDFLTRLKNRGVRVFGSELNKNAIRTLNQKEIANIDWNESKQDYLNYFDVICSFQVLEHVYNVHHFISTCVSLLKPGASLIVAVPNNDSVLLKNFNNYLDAPPHHVGHWNINSLLSLQKYFDLQVSKIYLEPLQYYHEMDYLDVIISNDYHLELFLKKIIKNILNKFVFSSSVNNSIVGQSIVVEYKKVG